jgi:hypothetical protein
MGLFKTDLFHSFLIGFLIGSAGIVTVIGADARAEIVQKLVQ